MFYFEKLTCNYAQAELSCAHNDQERGITMKQRLTYAESRKPIYDIIDILINIHKAGFASASAIEALARKLAYIEDRHYFLNREGFSQKARTHKRVYTWRFANWMAETATYEEPAKILGWDL